MTRQLSFIAAIATPLSVALLAFVGGWVTPGYSHVSQFISELGATNSVTEYPVRFLGFLPAGIALLAFSWFAHAATPKTRLSAIAFSALAIYALGYVAAAFFPCDAGCRPVNPSTAQLLHNALGGIGYLIAPAFMLAFGICARTWPASAPLPALAFVAAAVSLLGLASLSPSSPFVGLSQRAIEVSVLAWVVACGWHIRNAASTAES